MYMHDVNKMLIYDGTTGHINPHFYKHGSAVVRNDNREYFFLPHFISAFINLQLVSTDRHDCQILLTKRDLNFNGCILFLFGSMSFC